MDIHTVIQSQYHAALEMLSRIIDKCPDELWDRLEDKNRSWHLAYHALFYTHLYLSPTGEEFTPWEHHRPDYNSMGRQPYPPFAEPNIDEPYTKAEIRQYLEELRARVDILVRSTDLHAESGFDWIPLSKLELQFYNIRHLMQHIGELSERLGSAAGLEVDWVGDRPKGD